MVFDVEYRLVYGQSVGFQTYMLIPIQRIQSCQFALTQLKVEDVCIVVDSGFSVGFAKRDEAG
jgi:hypothetical protein